MTDDMYFTLDSQLSDPAERQALRNYYYAASAADKAIARRDRAIIKADKLIALAKQAHQEWAGE